MSYGAYTLGYAPLAPSTVVAARSTTWRALRSIILSRPTSWSTASAFTNQATVPMVQLRVYQPNGADQGILPAPMNTAVAYPLDDVGSLTVSYLYAAPRSALLGQPCEIAVELSPDKGQTWVEPPDSRFRYVSDGADPLADLPSYDVTCEAYVGRLVKAVVYPNGLLNNDGKRAFLSVTPGVILKTLLNEAQARGALSGLVHSSFSTSTDSAGHAWSSTITIYYDPGIDYLTILRDLADQGFVDFRTRGRSLDVYNADTALAVDRSTGAGIVTLVPGRDLTEGPFRRTWENIATDALFAGDGTASYQGNNPGAADPWGREEIFISNGSVSDAGTMAALTQAELSQRDQERTEHTRGLDFARAVSLPFWDYAVGDYVLSTLDGSLPTSLRVRQITLNVTDQGVLSGNVVLNDRFLEADVRQARRITGITNGASSGPGTGGGGGGEGTDKIAPAKVSGLVGSSLAYFGPGGFTQAQVSLDWADVTTNLDGTAIDDLNHYEVWRRPFGSNPATDARFVASTTTPQFDSSPYTPGSQWWFKVLAVDNTGNRGPFSNELGITMASDATPPQAPSTPVVTARLGQLYIDWDGLPATGSWPLDFDHVEVHTSLTDNFTPGPTTLFAIMYGRGPASTVYAEGAYGVPVYVRFVAVDSVGNQSIPSATASGTPTRLVGSDLDPTAITFDQIAFKDIGNIVNDGSFETDDFRTTVTARSHPDWTFTTSNRFHGAYSAQINAATTPLVERQLVLMVAEQAQTIKAGEKLFCRYAYQGSGGATGNVALVAEWLIQDGSLTTSTLPSTVKNGVWQQAAAQLTAPTGVQEVRIYLILDNTANVGTFYVDAVEVRRTVATAIIEDAAIGNAQIANLAVNDGKVANLSAGKLTAGTMSAVVLIAGTLRTATSGARVEITSTGIRLFDAANAVKTWLDPSGGRLRIFNTTDGTYSSTGHGFQCGPDNAQNLIIDDNEVMGRNNGSYGQLCLNREGGQVLIGGRTGGFPDFSDASKLTYPADDNHYVEIRSAVQILNVSDAEYADEYAPLSVGWRGGFHLWMDGNEIGAANADSPSTFIIQGPRNTPTADGDLHHIVECTIGSGSLALRRSGDYSSGSRQGFIYGNDSGNDTGLRWDGGVDALQVRQADNTGFRDIQASAFTVSSEAAVKHSISDFDPIKIIRRAPGRRWKYRDDLEKEDRWHHGPMLDDLPEEMHRSMGGIGEDHDDRPVKGYNLADLAGVLWEAVRRLDARLDVLESDGRER